MLSLKNLSGGGAGAVIQYCEHAREKTHGYYDAKTAPSSWAGSLAASAGLVGPVDAARLTSLLEGTAPDGTRLEGAGREDHRMGVDLTFSAPKSVSLMCLAGGDDRIAQAHDAAVQEALVFIEREVAGTRRGKAGAGRESTRKLLAAVYRHEDAREAGTGRVDPQLHSHAIALNMTQGSDGKWLSLDMDFGQHVVLMHTADAIYKNELARHLRSLGYETRLTGDGFEIDGLSQSDIDAFSHRRDQIDAALEERGLTRADSSAAQRSAANLATRGGKSQLSRPDQRWQWRGDARESGVDLTALRAAADARAGRQVPEQDLTDEAIRAAVRHVSERETVFSRHVARLESLKAGMGRVDLADLEAGLDTGAAGLLDAGTDAQGRRRMTTRDALHREQHILQRARAGRGQVVALMSDNDAAVYIERKEAAQGFAFSPGQRNALTLSLVSSDRVTGVKGAAGSGKTTSMAGFVAAAKERGYEVVGVAPSAAASHELQSAGADDTRTVASLLASKESVGSNRVYVLDEAGMVSSRDMDSILERADTEGARLLMVGDPLQFSAVEAGSPFQQMLETDAIRYAVIDEIQRQRDPALREIAQAFARGDAARAAELARPYMHEVVIPKAGEKPTVQEKRAAIARTTAADYLKRNTDTRNQTLVVSGTNDLRQQINAQIREGLRAQGAVSKESVTVKALDKAGLTREQRARAESYKPGMVVRLEEGRGRERRQVEYSVQEVHGNTVTVAIRDGQSRDWNPAKNRPAGVYQPRDMELSPGDKIVFRENQKGVDRIRNGESATIVRVADGKPVARLDSGKEVVLDPVRGQTVDYGWCRTIHAAQGATVNHVLVAGEASRVATAQMAYVAASRERDMLTVYTDNSVTLEKNWARFAEREYAVAAAQDHSRPTRESMKELRAEAAAALGREGDLAFAREQQALNQQSARVAQSTTATPPRQRDRERELDR